MFRLLFLILSILYPIVCLAGNLRPTLENLAQKHKFSVSGLHLLKDEAANATGGNLRDQLKSLLQDYNYLVSEGKAGRITQIIITSEKAPRTNSPYVRTTRVGAHHQVEANLTGPGGSKSLKLIVDTGASSIVLPSSMIPELGFQPDDLSNGKSHTANGMAPVRIGTLRTVQVGNVTANDVKVAFIDNKRLGETMLLGMSFLERFKVIIDDANSEMVLIAK